MPCTLVPKRGTAPDPLWLDAAGVLNLFDADPNRARQGYQQFVADGIVGPSPWTEITGQIFLGILGVRPSASRMAALLPDQGPANVPQAQSNPTRLTAPEIMTPVGAVYGIMLRQEPRA
jgi:hypothetical protein